MVLPHPNRFQRERTYQLPVQPAGGAVVNVFDTGRPLQSAIAQTSIQRMIFAPCPLAVDEQPEPLFEAQLLAVGAFLLQAEGLRHTFEAHRA